MRAALGLCFGLLLGQSVWAQDRMTDADCVAGLGLIEMVFEDISLPDQTVSDDGWCESTDISVQAGPAHLLQMTELRWRASDMARVAEQGLPPRALELNASGLRLAAASGDPVFDYLIALQSARRSHDLRLRARWDGVQNALVLEELFVDFPGANSVALSGRFDGVSLASQEEMQDSLPTAMLSNLELVVETNGLFEGYVALPLGMALLDSETEPEAQVQSRIGQAVNVIEGLGDAVMAPRSKDALVAFLTDLPMPSGVLRLQLDAAPGLTVAELAALMDIAGDETAPQFEQLLERLTLRANWTRLATGQPE